MNKEDRLSNLIQVQYRSNGEIVVDGHTVCSDKVGWFKDPAVVTHKFRRQLQAAFKELGLPIQESGPQIQGSGVQQLEPQRQMQGRQQRLKKQDKAGNYNHIDFKTAQAWARENLLIPGLR